MPPPPISGDTATPAEEHMIPYASLLSNLSASIRLTF